MGKTLRKFKTVSLEVLFAFLSAGVFSCGAQTLGEAVDAPNFVWITGGDSIWTVQTTNTHDGIDAASSGVVGSNQTSWIETTVIGPATVRYWIRVGSGGFSSVFARFTVNEDQQGYLFPSRFIDSPWSNEIYDLGDGTNVLRLSVFNRTTNHDLVLLDEFIVEPPRPLTIEYQSADQTVFSGATAFFYVSVFGPPPIRFQWQKDGRNILDATNSWLQLENTSTNDSGVYSVMVSNAQNSLLSTNALLTVFPPSAPIFYYEPESSTAYTGQTLYLWCGVDGSPPFTYQWRKEGTNLPYATRDTLTFTNISQADAGNYTLVVSNAIGGTESSNIVISVFPSIAPGITRHPRSLEVATGVNTWMSTVVTGSPDPCLRWIKIGDESQNPEFPPVPIVCQRPVHSFNNVNSNDAGIYYVTATNAGGNVISRKALLTVLPPLTLKGSWNQGAQDIFVTNGIAFLACGYDGLTILNVSNPASPQLLGIYDTPGRALSVRVAGNLAFIADGSSGLQIINVANPFSPVLVGNYNTTGNAYDLALQSNLVFIADGEAGIVALNVTNPATPKIVGSYSNSLSARTICVSGNIAYVTATGFSPYVSTMLMIDVSNPAQLEELSHSGTRVAPLDIRDNLVFAADALGQGIKIFDIINPVQPSQVGSFYIYTNRISASDIQVVNDLVYVCGFSDKMQLIVLNVRNPTEPIPVGYFTASDYAGKLFVDENMVYIAGQESVLIIETPFYTQPASPRLSLANQNGLKLQCHGRRGFNYAVEQSDQLNGSGWLPIQTILLTNQNSIIELPSPTETEFFRLRQLD